MLCVTFYIQQLYLQCGLVHEVVFGNVVADVEWFVVGNGFVAVAESESHAIDAVVIAYLLNDFQFQVFEVFADLSAHAVVVDLP